MLGKIFFQNRDAPGNIGLVTYRNSLNIGITEEGLYLSFIFIMRLFHPPLLIPWEKISKAGINSFDEYDIYVDIPIFPNSPTIIRLPKETLEKAEYILKDKSNN